MGKVMLGAGYDLFTVRSGRFWPLGGAAFAESGNYNSVEARAQFKIDRAGTVSSLNIYLDTLTTGSVHFRQNGSSVITRSVASESGYLSQSASLALAADDLINIDCELPLNSRLFYTTAIFEASVGHASFYSGFDGNGCAVGSGVATTYYLPFAGEISAYASNTNRELVSFTSGIAGKIKNVQLYISANTRTTTTTARTNIGGSAGNNTIAITAGQTGLVRVTGVEDNLAIGDEFCLEIINGTGTGTLTVYMVGCTIENNQADDFSDHFTAGNDGRASPGGGATHWIQLLGDIKQGTSDTEEVRTRFGFDAVFGQMRLYVASNAHNGPAVFRFTKNEDPGTQTVTVPAGGTGFFDLDDPDAVDQITSTDHVMIAVDYQGTSGDLVVAWLGLTYAELGETPSGATGTGTSESEGGGSFEDTTWPVTFIPTATGIIAHHAPVSGGPGLAGVEDVEETGNGFWEIVLDRIPIRTKSDVLYFREIEAKALGRIGVFLVHFCDGKRAPWPGSGGPAGGAIIAAASGDFLPGDTTGAIELTAGSELRPGMHWSVGERFYRLEVVGTPSGGIYPVTIWPKVREFISSGSALEFQDLVMRGRLKDVDAMHTALDVLRFAQPTLSFVEDVLP